MYTIKYDFQGFTMSQSQVFAYCRVSTSEQAEDKDSLVKQMRRLRAAGATKIYYDVESRTVDTRRGLMQLIADVSSSPAGLISKFLFVRVDRLTSSNNVFYTLMDALNKKEIKSFALDEPFDIASIGGELTIDVRLAAAKYEIKMLSMRVKKERDARKKDAKAHWNAPYGYIVNNDSYYLDHREVICLLEGKRVLTRAELVRHIFDTFFEVGTINKTVATLHQTFGIESKAIVKSKEKRPNIVNEDDELNYESIKSMGGGSVIVGYSAKSLKWTVSGLKNTLVNPVYAGGTPYDINLKLKSHKKPFEQWTVAWGSHGNTDDYSTNNFGATGEAIITRLEYDRVKEVITSNRHNRWSNEQKFTNPFAGLLKCAHCGAAYTRQSKKLVKSKNFIRHHYQCSFYHIKACTNKTMISSDVLEKQVVELLVQEADRLSVMGSQTDFTLQESQELKTLKTQLAGLEALPPSLDIAGLINKVRQDIAAIDQSTAAQTTQYLVSKDLIIEEFKHPETWLELEPSDKTALLQACIRKIIVDGNRVVSIEYKY